VTSKKQGNGIIESKVGLYSIKVSSHIFVSYTGVPELAPQRKQTNADDNIDAKNANEEQLIACIREL
jgi:hypothetical protein